MIQVASSFSTEPSLDVVLSSIPTRIFEAVYYLKDNMDSFTAKVETQRFCKEQLSCFSFRLALSKILAQR